jgi:trans-aconitate 2-methyltransferase
MWAPAMPPELIYSNAALHWVTNHETLFPRLLRTLAPGGVLAIQMPSMHDAPFRMLQNEVAATGPWAPHLASTGSARSLLPTGTYYDILRPHAAHLDMWETTFLHVLHGDNAVTEWAAGSSLRPFLEKLPDALRQPYREAYSEALKPHYPRRADGTTLLPFKRLFIVARL